MYNVLEQLTHAELIEAVKVAAIKKNKKLNKRKDLIVNFRWGSPQDEIIASIDELIKE